MRARWLRFGAMLGLSLGVVGLALAIGMTRGDAPGAGAQTTATPTTASWEGVNLTLLPLSGNSLTGCVPNALAEVAAHDLGTSVAFCPAPAPDLTVLADGVAGVLILEWTSTAVGVTRWQYRTRGPIWEGVLSPDWGAWTDIPGSSASTRSYRLTGLRRYRGYDIEVRAWAAARAGSASTTFEATTLLVGSDSIPEMYPNQPVLGGKTYRIGGLAWVVDVPASIRVVAGSGRQSWNTGLTVRVTDITSKKYFVIDGNTGEILENSGSTREIGGSSESTVTPFDQMVASLRRVAVPVPRQP